MQIKIPGNNQPEVDVEQCLKILKENLRPEDLKLLADFAKSDHPLKGKALRKLRSII